MGNRAVITTNNNLGEVGYSDKVKHYYTDIGEGPIDLQDRKDKVGIYLHWNGGRDSINGFLAYCNIKGYRDPTEDNYGMARLIQVISNFFGGSNSIGVDTLNHLDCDNCDNGVYIIGSGWQIVDRVYFEGSEQNGCDMLNMLQSINKAQPEKERLSEENLKQAYDKIKNKYKGM